MRIGQGYDVHKLVPDRELILGGVTIPYEKGLLGHSDADVLVHAVMDALLGAAALGDIGQHFPDTDPAYEGASSIELLKNAALREDPDVILIGEMHDPATIETALMAAETGHLVFSTIHTNSAIDSIDRIVGVFPEDKQPQIRTQISMTLRAVLSQQLVPRAGGQGRAAACELMMLTPAIRNLIRDGKTPQMQSYLLSSAKEGSITMDNFLIRMAKEGVITPQTAVDASQNPQELREKLAAVQY